MIERPQLFNLSLSLSLSLSLLSLSLSAYNPLPAPPVYLSLVVKIGSGVRTPGEYKT